MATGNDAGTETFVTGGSLANNPQFFQCQSMFREYAVSSLKIEYRPVHYQPSTLDLRKGTILCGTSMDTLNAYPCPIDTYRAALDFKQYDSDKPFKRFYRVQKYANTKLIKWRSTRDAVTGVNG